ncbi:MAG: hypothetical protein K6G78_03010 [bacterium]|nr:hypothetical protein [bacterium]
MNLSRSIVSITFATALMGMLIVGGCSDDASRSAPSQQQGVSDILQEQKQSGESDGQGASNGTPRSGLFPADAEPTYSKVDYDLTKMGSDMVYATVNDMMVNPSSYEGKVIRMSGVYYHSRDERTGNDYFFVVIQDATACCSQGLEFVWGDGSRKWPQDYPEDGCEVTVTGVFEIYMEDEFKYVHLTKSSLEKA